MSFCENDCPSCAAIFHPDDQGRLDQLWLEFKREARTLGFNAPNGDRRDRHFGNVFKMIVMDWIDESERVLVPEEDNADDPDYEPDFINDGSLSSSYSSTSD